MSLTIRIELECDKCGEMFDTEFHFDVAPLDLENVGMEMRSRAKDAGWLIEVKKNELLSQLDYCPECRRIYEH